AQRQRFVAVIDHKGTVVGAGDCLRTRERLTAGALLRLSPEEGQADGFNTRGDDGARRIGAWTTLGVDATTRLVGEHIVGVTQHELAEAVGGVHGEDIGVPGCWSAVKTATVEGTSLGITPSRPRRLHHQGRVEPDLLVG